jgi:UDP-N-acetylglucosamine--N-acetylmuramyl-(pentapeptide) pyrophosphoryl-undecaprenol N-acetylglucosamine transferase
LAAGGTGGHIYPALEVGRALREAAPGLPLRYFCGDRPGELAIYRENGIEPVILPLSGRSPGLANQFRFSRRLLQSWRTCRSLAARERPRVAIGFGGYASAPVLWAARSRGAATMIQEQNAFPGLANRLLGRRAVRIFAGMPLEGSSLNADKTRVTGNPVRRDILEPPEKAEALRHWGIPAGAKVVLAFGGSLGATGLNTLVGKALESESARRWHWIWATGPSHLESVRAKLNDAPGLMDQIHLCPYVSEMNRAYAAADLVICRAGALTLAELAVSARPSILIPLPTSAAGHQRANAQRFESAGAARVVEQDDPAADQKIVTWLEQFEADCDKLNMLGEAARRLGHPDAARDIVSDILRFL